MPVHGFKLRFATTRLAWKGKGRGKWRREKEDRQISNERRRFAPRIPLATLPEKIRTAAKTKPAFSTISSLRTVGLPLLPFPARLICSKADPPSMRQRIRAANRWPDESKYLSILLISIFL